MSDNGKRTNSHKVGAVMVVGGGICGMQASLDLASSGFKVYLVEETTSIGGRMAQLDKTFPTNDCSMCMISPKLIEVGRHPNIEIITNAEILALEGEEGNFKARVHKKPRFIDLTKCSSCGDCLEVCPVSVASEFEEGLAERKAIFKRYPQAIPSAVAISKRGTSPCKIGCPIHTSVQGYVALIAQGKYQEALDVIRDVNPLPGVCGTVCTHPCELECSRTRVDEAISIRDLKRFATDKACETDGASSPPAIAGNGKKVAVVGSGPAGLAAAYDLVRMGYGVTVFEALPVAGGMLAVGIPEYRLPKAILERDLKYLQALGIEIKTNTPIGPGLTLDDLSVQGYSAFFLATGCQKGVKLRIPGLSDDIPTGVSFLRDVNTGKKVAVGRKVLVLGGGNVAFDCARTALRLGASEVHVSCLESREQMPAHPEEIEEAEQEGIIIHASRSFTQVQCSNGSPTGVECLELRSMEFDKEGRLHIDPIAGSEHVLSCDMVILAVGQATDLGYLDAIGGIEVSKRGNIVADPKTMETSRPGVFAGGDAVLRPASAIEAIATGKEAAISIDRYLKGEDIKANREPMLNKFEAPIEGVRKSRRAHTPKIPAEERKSVFREVSLGLPEEVARAEAERCLACGICSECFRCVVACQAKAIDHTMMEETLEIPVGSVILTPGFEEFDATLKDEYGYGRMANVVSSMQFERILSASGPFQGQVLRPSDGKHAVKIGWIQCVGSRDESIGRDYCSSVCCMYATKEAIIAREHASDIQPTIFFNDMRAHGKGFERYYESARDKFGIRYVRGIPSAVKELQKTKNLVLEYNTDEGRKVEEFDMVVLSVGMVPAPSTRELASRLSVELDRFGFCRTEDVKPNVTSRPGIYVAGAFDAPMDIPESVMNASGAAHLASQCLAEARGTMVVEKTYPEEIDFTDQPPRIGVFVCRCGTNIARVVDVPTVAEYAKTLPNVVHAEENLYTCSTDTQIKIVNTINEKKLNRVVVASCSPRTHEPLFQDTIRQAGLNRFLFEMANIRDQCSWVHGSHPVEASEKARDLVRMAVARAATLGPLRQSRAEVKRSGLVIGGGAAGMTAALGLASQGFEAVLVEREEELGGNLKHIHYTLEGTDGQQVLADLVKRVEQEPLIKLYKGATVKEFGGYVGNYETTLALADGSTSTVEHGVVILATGATEYSPAEYGAGQSDKVVTQVQLHEGIVRGAVDPKKLRSVVMVQCVGSREPEHMYCSRICCGQAIANALKIKDENPDAEVYILYRDIRTYAMKELKYREARDRGVTFIRYDVDRKPEVDLSGPRPSVKVFDSVLGTSLLLEADLVVLSAAVRPQGDAGELASKLKLPLTQDGFFMEAHMKLRPLDFINEGMYLCGMAHSPKTVAESIAQAQGAVSRAATILSQPYLMVGGIISVIDQDRCVACLTCVRSCPFRVPRINEDGVAEIEAAACRGCGICAGACPRKAIRLQHYADEQVLAKTGVLVPV